jgi:hypothetical protein
MTNNFSKIIILLSVGFAVAVFFGCNTASTNTPAPQPACKLLKSVYTAYAAGSTTTANTTNTSTYTYNGENLIKKVDEYIYTGTPTVTNTTNYTYNTDGFVTSETFMSVGTTTTTSTSNYTYNTNGKVTAIGSSRSFEYDATGNLTKTIVGTATRTYMGGVLTAVTSSTAYPVTTVQNGRITKIQSSATFYAEYSFDTQGRLSETKLYSNSSLSNRTVYEYASTVVPTASATPVFKGMPVIASDWGTGYVSKTTQYNAAGTIINVTDYVNAFNTRGYPISVVLNSANMGINGTLTYTQGTTYTYQDCQ